MHSTLKQIVAGFALVGGLLLAPGMAVAEGNPDSKFYQSKFYQDFSDMVDLCTYLERQKPGADRLTKDQAVLQVSTCVVRYFHLLSEQRGKEISELKAERDVLTQRLAKYEVAEFDNAMDTYKSK